MMEQETPTMNPAQPIAALDLYPTGTTGDDSGADSSLADALAAIPDDAFSRTPMSGLAAHPLALDVLETADSFAIHATVPGIDPAALDIMVFGESVRIAGVSAGTTHLGDAGARWLLRERPAGRFDRSVNLPSPIAPDAASASVEDGVLVVTLPKANLGGLTRIPIRSLPATDRSAAPAIDA